ncbi:AraC family transcriptional regulator [Cytobacillus sp. Hm23]
MSIITIPAPPFPTYIKGGRAIFHKGQRHFKRTFIVFDLIYVCKGVVYITEDDIPYEIKEGQYIILVPGIEHYGHRGCTEKSEYIWMHFQTEQTYQLEKSRSLNWSHIIQRQPTFVTPAHFHLQIPRLGAVRRQGYMENVMEKVISLNELQNPEVHIQQQLYFQDFIFHLQKEALSIPDASEKLAEQVVIYLKERYKENFLLEDVARDLHFHADYITRCMQRSLGMTPLQFLTQYRLFQAKKLLTTTDKRVMDIGKEVGIQDYTYFSKLFKQHEGMSPVMYRKEVSRSNDMN